MKVGTNQVLGMSIRAFAGVTIMAIILMVIASSCGSGGGTEQLPIDTQRKTPVEISEMAKLQYPEDTSELNVVDIAQFDYLSVPNIKEYLNELVGQFITLKGLDIWYSQGLFDQGVTYTSNSSNESVTISTDITIGDIVEMGAASYTAYLFKDHEDDSVFYIGGGYAVIEDFSAITDEDGNIQENSTSGSDLPPDISSIYEVTSDPLIPDNLTDNPLTFLRDHEGMYVAIAGLTVWGIDEDGTITTEEPTIFLRHQEQIYDVTMYEEINVYGKVERNPYRDGGIYITDAQIVSNEYYDPFG